jgi:hypothetical protein
MAEDPVVKFISLFTPLDREKIIANILECHTPQLTYQISLLTKERDYWKKKTEGLEHVVEILKINL